MELDLPGFRFHPTEEELLDFYLKRMIQGKKLEFEVITTINIYRHDPWELSDTSIEINGGNCIGLAKIGEREWYFYVPRDRKQASGGRPSRTTERGFWKATGSDRPMRSAADPKRFIGLKKTLVYYERRAPRGTKTDWVMNEYRLPGPPISSSDAPPKEEDVVLCKIYRKATSVEELEQRAAAALEEEMAASQVSGLVADSSPGWSDQDVFQLKSSDVVDDDVIFTGHTKEVEMREEVVDVPGASTRRPRLPELEVPRYEGLEWLQDPFLTQLRSPWMVDLWSPYDPSILNL